MSELRPVGTVFEDVLEYPDKRIIVTKRVIGHDNAKELTMEVSRTTQPKAAPRPTETK